MITTSSVWVKWPLIAKSLGGLGVTISVLMIAGTREELLQNNMFDVEKYPQDVVCDERSKIARTEDGTCNDLENPAMGAAFIRFGRNVPVEETFAETEEDTLLSPNPRELSRTLMTREEFVPATSLNFIAAAWIQFMVHDWISHGENDETDTISIPLAADDPFGGEFMEVRRTRKDSTRTADEANMPMTYQNVNTHWWDGSQIYGSDVETNNDIRSFTDGKLKVLDGNRLPTDFSGVPVTGFTDNWWLGLSMMHQLFVMEHNAIAEMLKAKHPDWDDQRLYDVARLVNAALMAKIHTVEWTPSILANPVLRKSMDSNWYGFLGEENQAAYQRRVKRMADSLAYFDWLTETITGTNPQLSDKLDNLGAIQRALGGLVGARKAEFYGVPYTLTEEFTSVYRMHPLLRDNVDVYSVVDGSSIASIPLEDTRDGDAEAIMSEQNITDLWYSFGVTHPGALTLQNYPKFLQDLNIPLVGNIDLATIDILRDRERGVPRYNQFRRLIGLNPITEFEDLTKDEDLLNKLKALYNNDIEQIDLLVGSLAETVRPDGFGFGETSFQIFILNASRRLMTDRFFTEDYRPEIYTEEGLAWVADNTMITVLGRHFPSLAAKMGNVDSAFEPWE